MEFKRDIYYKLQEMLHNTNVIFLLGPRKCGKTTALQQLKIDNPEVHLIDFKKLSKEESMDTINKIVKDILQGNEEIYFLDEMTHAFFPETEIEKIADAYTQVIASGTKVKTKIIFSGSQSVALGAWGRRAFCNQAQFINLDFLSYPEWLRYKGREDVTAESYADFIKGTSEFYNFTTVKDYLEGCLEETVVSNANSRNYIYGNDCELINADELTNILYLTIFSLHDVSSPQTFFKNNVLSDKIAHLSRQIESKNPMSLAEIRERVSKSFLNKYNNLKAINMDTLKQSFAFLMRCELITATPIFSNMEQDNVNVLKQLENIDGIYKKKNDLLGKVNFTINYPMFFVEILKEILKDDFTEKISGNLMGSIVECHVRGLLPSYSAYEYHDEFDREIDYINRSEGKAIEITISNKDMKNVHLNLLPEEDGYKKILLTKDVRTIINDIEKIPYYEFIYELSGGKSRPQPTKTASLENKSSTQEELTLTILSDNEKQTAQQFLSFIEKGEEIVTKSVPDLFVSPLKEMLHKEGILFLIMKDEHDISSFYVKESNAEKFLEIQKKVFQEIQPPKLEPEITNSSVLKINEILQIEDYDDM